MKKTLLGYVPEQSLVYSFHPLSRMITVFVLTLIPLFTTKLAVNLTLIGLTLALFVVSKISLKVLKKYAFIFVILFIFILLIYSFFIDKSLKTNPIEIVGGFFYWDAFAFAIRIYIRIASILFMTIYFLNVITETEIVAGFRKIKVPFIICYTIGLAFRAIGMFLEDYKIVRESERARAIDFKDMGFFQKIFKMINYIIPLMALAIRRTDEFSDAIIARGFSFSSMKNRPSYLTDKYKINMSDYALMGFCVLVCLSLIYFKWVGLI
jgi:energy-coupling factor transporter transmembrane protein EcfT